MPYRAAGDPPLLPPTDPGYWAAFTELKNRCIRDFLRAALFFLMIPFPAAVSIFLIMSFSAASASVISFFWARASNFLTLVLTAVRAD
jgi:hypothetical protein